MLRAWMAWLGSIVVVLAVLCGCSEDSTDSAATTAGTNATMVIEPRVGVGAVHAGMNVQQVVAAWGEPSRKTEKALDYRSLGLAVIPDTNGIVQMIMCGDVTGNSGPYVAAFKGRTKEGIGMNSTSADLINAYGEPDNAERYQMGIESISYNQLGMTFTLGSGRVYHLIVRLGGEAPPKGTVKLEPASP
jgi:hypothetical protein